MRSILQSSVMNSPKIGVIFSEKKLRSAFFKRFIDALRRLGDVSLIDFNQPVADQGHFDIIVHKLTDWMSNGDEQSNRRIADFEVLHST